MGVHEDTVQPPAGQNKFKDEYKDTDEMPKMNKSDMGGTMEVIKEYLKSCHIVIRAPLAYDIRKTILVKAYGEYHKHTTPDDEIIARILHLPPDKNKLLQEQDAQ